MPRTRIATARWESRRAPEPAVVGRRKRGTLHPLRAAAFLAFVLVFSQGCAAVLAAGSAVAFGLTYYSSNVAERSFTAELPKVWDATLGALDEMAIPVLEKDLKGGGGGIQATATDLTIAIDLTAVTPMTTRVTVNAAKSNLLRDMATATEILERISGQLGKRLARGAPQISRAPTPAPVRPSPAVNGASSAGTRPASGRSAGLVQINATAANVRASAATDSRILAVLQQGTKLEKIGDTPGWVKVKLSDGAEGFIAQGLVIAVDGSASGDKRLAPPAIPVAEYRGQQ